MAKKRILVLASGSATGGGSGFANLVVQSQLYPRLDYEIVAVVSNHERGGVRRHAETLHVPFEFFSSGTWSADEYRRYVEKYEPEHVACSGWLKPVRGLDPSTTSNIHPGRTSLLGPTGKPIYGGKGMHGEHVHEAAVLEYGHGRLKYSGVTMHFVPDFDAVGYDQGPIFFEYLEKVYDEDVAATLGKRVNVIEHHFQPIVTSLAARGEISWSGKKGDPVQVPSWYPYLPIAA